MTNSNTDYIAGVVEELLQRAMTDIKEEPWFQMCDHCQDENNDTCTFEISKAMKFFEAKLKEAQAFALREVMPEEDYDGWSDCLSQLKSNALNKLNITL